MTRALQNLQNHKRSYSQQELFFFSPKVTGFKNTFTAIIIIYCANVWTWNKLTLDPIQ